MASRDPCTSAFMITVGFSESISARDFLKTEDVSTSLESRALLPRISPTGGV